MVSRTSASLLTAVLWPTHYRLKLCEKGERMYLACSTDIHSLTIKQAIFRGSNIAEDIPEARTTQHCPSTEEHSLL